MGEDWRRLEIFKYFRNNSSQSIINYEKAMKAAGSFGNKKYVFDKK